MNATHTTTSPRLAERLNRSVQSCIFRAQRPFRVDADDLVLRLSPAVDFRDPHHRTLSLSGGEQSTRRPAYVRVILSVAGTFHPDCEESSAWVIQDLGLIELGGTVDIDIARDATFHLTFAEPIETTVEVPVDGQRFRITLPKSEHGWSCSDERYAIATDQDLPNMALVKTRALPVPAGRNPPAVPIQTSGYIPPRMVGGGANREPLTVRALLSDCPLGLVRIDVYQDSGLLERRVLRSSLWPVYISQNRSEILDHEIPASFVMPDDHAGGVKWDAVPVTETDLRIADLPRLREILRDGLVHSSQHFPPECLQKLQAFLQKHNDEKAR